ncbi:GtrA family protein [Comamonas humi]
MLRGHLPLSLLSFLTVGSLGVVVHMAVLNLSIRTWAPSFLWANGSAMLVAATFNYSLNNETTFLFKKLRGRQWFLGYPIYLLVTSLGLGVSLLASNTLYQKIHMPMVAALAGIVLGALWNYLMTQKFVWKLLHKEQPQDGDNQASLPPPGRPQP